MSNENKNENGTEVQRVTHPTQYSSLSEVEVKSLFASDNWNNLSPEQRLDACQEIENRLAAERNTDSREVSAIPMTGSVYGYQSGNQITMNSHLLNDGVFVIEYEDFEGNARTNVVSVNASNWESLSTLYHEDLHGAWEDKGIMPVTYIEPGTSQELYVLQASEKAAFITEERETLSAIREVTQHMGKADPTALDYMEAHKGSLYQENLAKAQELFNDPNIEDTLNQYISDRDNGITRKDPSPSYEKIDELYIQQTIRNYFGTSKEDPTAEQAVRDAAQAANEKNAAAAQAAANDRNNAPSTYDGTDREQTASREAAPDGQESAQQENDGSLLSDEPSHNDRDAAQQENDGTALSEEATHGDREASSQENDGATVSQEGREQDGGEMESDGATLSSEGSLNEREASDMETDGASVAAEGPAASYESGEMDGADMDGAGYDPSTDGEDGYSNDDSDGYSNDDD